MMSRVLKLRRGTTAQHTTFVGALGEITVDTTTDSLVVHDAVTAGGHRQASKAYVDSVVNQLQALPPSPVGSVGDQPGMIAGTSAYVYYCIAEYDGSSLIWHRVANDGNTGWTNP
jgi:hypothetical protein